MTKKKILSIVLGVVICFNVCFSRPQRVEAVAGVDDATILIALYNALCGTVFLNNNSNSFSFSDNEFVDYYRTTHENSELYSYLIGQTAVANVSGGICGGFLSKAFLNDFVLTVNDFWASKGDFSSEGYTYSSGDSVANGNLQQYIDFFAPIVSETLGISLDSARYWVQDWGPIKRASEPLYITFCREDFYGNNSIIGFTIHYSSTGYMDFNNNQTINSEYPTFWVDTFGGGVSYSYNTVFNGTSPFTPYDPVSYFYYTPGIEGTSSSVTSTAELTSDGQDLASDPEDYADKISSRHADTVVTHNSNGSVSVDEDIAFNIGIKEEVDEDGNVIYTPIIPDSASAAGFTLDDILSKPSEVEKYPTAVDDTSAQAISGTVSVTGFQRFGMQVISHLLTHTSWLEKIHNGILSIPSYMDILTAIKDAIPSVIDYSDVLEGIKAGILGIAIPNVLDYTEVLNGIKAGILGISIPNVLDYTNVLEGIKAGILGISIPNVLDYTEVLEGIKAGILGIAIPNIIDYTEVLNGIKTGILSGLSTLFIPDTTAFDGLTDIITDKFSIVFQLEELWDTLLGSDFGSSKVEFTITIPGWFLHSDSDRVCLLIDFSVFDDYRSFLHAVIILLSYLAFAKRLVDRIPTVLGYPGGGSDTVIVKE